jgi:hypothetical protein
MANTEKRASLQSKELRESMVRDDVRCKTDSAGGDVITYDFVLERGPRNWIAARGGFNAVEENEQHLKPQKIRDFRMSAGNAEDHHRVLNLFELLKNGENTNTLKVCVVF